MGTKPAKVATWRQLAKVRFCATKTPLQVSYWICAMLRAALFVLLLSCASALQLPSHGRPRLVPLSSSSSGGGGGGLSVRSGPITCKTTDEDWARRWPNATPEELANMKKWCAAGPTRRKGSGVIHKLHRSAAPLHRCTAAPLHRVLP